MTNENNAKYVNSCLECFFIWVSKSPTPVFYDNPEEYNQFIKKLDRLNSDDQFTYLIKALQDFQSITANSNPLDTLFSQLINWNVNIQVVLKEFIPYVLRISSYAKFKREGAIIQTNTNLYLFNGLLQELLEQTNFNKNTNNPTIESLLTIYLAIRYRQTYGEKEHSLFEDRFHLTYSKYLSKKESKIISNFKDSFNDFRQKLLNQKITNETLYTSLKNLQNILGKNAMTSAKKETFFWQMYADLECVDKPNFKNQFQENFLLQIKYSKDNKIMIFFNKDQFKAMKHLGFIERIGIHRVIYVYTLQSIYQKLTDTYTHDYSERGGAFVEALRASGTVFSNFVPFIPEMEEYFSKNKEEVEFIYPQIIEKLNTLFHLNEIHTLDFFINYSLKEKLSILQSKDLKELYKPFL